MSNTIILDGVNLCADRFWTKVARAEPTMCWPWILTPDKNGYGVFCLGKRRYPAHAVACHLTYGPKPPGTECCHSCNNPPCCNPAHLRWDTRQGNVNDTVTAGRNHRGFRFSSPLTPTDIITIRTRFASGEPGPSIANDFPVGPAGIGFIVRGQTWRDIDGPITKQSRPGRRSRQCQTQ